MTTMIKKSVLKLAMTIMAAFMFTAVSGQIPAEYSETNTTDMYQTVNTNFRVYVQPDPVYNPDYVTNGDIDLNSFWQFILSGGLTAVTPDDITDPVSQNWVLVTASTIGEQTISATESFGAAGCDGSTQVQTVHVVGAPTGELTGDGSACGENVVADLVITFSEEDGIYDAFAYNISVKRQGYDVNGEPVGTAEDLADLSVPATNDGFVNSGSEVSTPNMEFVVDGTPLRTKYEFTLASVASRTSTVSQIRAGTGDSPFYAVADQTVTFWLNLPPVTGPIYHIPDTL